MKILAAIDNYWRPQVPATRLAAVRILVGAFATFYVLGRIGHLLSFGSFSAAQFAPIGVVSYASGPTGSLIHTLIVIATILFGVCLHSRLALSIYGTDFRGAASLDADLPLELGDDLSHREPSCGPRHRLGVGSRSGRVVLGRVAAEPKNAAGKDAATVLARLWMASSPALFAHRRNVMCWPASPRFVMAESAWVDGDVLKNYVAVDNLRKVLLGSPHSPLACTRFCRRVGCSRCSLCSPWSLSSERHSQWFGVVSRPFGCSALLSFHFGVLALMAIGFPYPMSGIAFVAFFPIERLEPRLRRVLAAIRAPIPSRDDPLVARVPGAMPLSRRRKKTGASMASNSSTRQSDRALFPVTVIEPLTSSR